MKPITKAQISVEDPYEIPKAVQRAVKTAMSGRRGPVFLEIRETALVRDASDNDVKNIISPEKYRPFDRPLGNPDQIKRTVEILKSAKKPLIVAGGGINASDAFEDLIKLSETYMIPAGTSINGIGAISSDKQTYVGSHLTLNTYRTAATEADVVLSIGCKWDYTLLYGAPPIWNQNQKLIQVDIDPEMIGRNRPVEVSIIGDAKSVINQLLSDMETSLPKEKITEWTEWNSYLQEIRKNDDMLVQKMLKSTKLPMKPSRLSYEVLHWIKEDAILALDGGDIAVFTFQLANIRPRPPRCMFNSVSMGHLGVGIPYAIGAKMAKPDKQVVCITGDGSFMFNIQELETAVRLKLPIIIIVANNSCWGMIKSGQKNNLMKRYCDVDFPETNYAEIAKGFGCFGEKVKNPEDIKPALQRAADSGKPAVIDVDVAFETPPAMKVIGLYKKSKGLFGR